VNSLMRTTRSKLPIILKLQQRGPLLRLDGPDARVLLACVLGLFRPSAYTRAPASRFAKVLLTSPEVCDGSRQGGVHEASNGVAAR